MGLRDKIGDVTDDLKGKAEEAAGNTTDGPASEFDEGQFEQSSNEVTDRASDVREDDENDEDEF